MGVCWEYKTLVIEGHPDRLLNAAGADGWECYAAVRGGFDPENRNHHIATAFYLKRSRGPESGAPKPAKKI